MEKSVCVPCQGRRWLFWASLPTFPPGLELQGPGCCCESHLHSVVLLGEARPTYYLWHGPEGSVPSGLHGYEGSPCSSPRNQHSQNASCWCHCEQVSRGIASIR